jgi:hypothetical protein
MNRAAERTRKCVRRASFWSLSLPAGRAARGRVAFSFGRKKVALGFVCHCAQHGRPRIGR